jgi:four helix bundle protein
MARWLAKNFSSRSPFYLLLSLDRQLAFAFEKPIYQKAIDFSDRICQTTLNFPRGFYFLVDQMSRAALSIATNIAEANGRFTIRDRRNFFGIARGSTQECVPLLEPARRRGLIDAQTHTRFKAELEEIAKMISGLVNACHGKIRAVEPRAGDQVNDPDAPLRSPAHVLHCPCLWLATWPSCSKTWRFAKRPWTSQNGSQLPLKHSHAVVISCLTISIEHRYPEPTQNQKRSTRRDRRPTTRAQ